jgi:site-specific DNA-methyltransferase (adenine-specific)
MILLSDTTRLPVEPEIVDLIITSPPYDNMRDYKGHFTLDYRTIIKELLRVTKPGGVVVWVVADAVIKGSESGSSFRHALCFKDAGFNLHQTMIYETDKPPIPVTHRRYQKCFEYMFVFSKGKPNTFNPIMEKSRHSGTRVVAATYRNQDGTLKARTGRPAVAKTKLKSAIWYLPSGLHKTTSDKFAFDHPAMFPEQLARNHIVTWTKLH